MTISKKIIVECCKKIIVDEKDLKEGIYKKKGYEFDLICDSEIRHLTFFEAIFTCKYHKERDIYNSFRLLDNIKLKYVVCPVCGKKVWLNFPCKFDLTRNYKTVKLKRWATKWKTFIPHGYGVY